jgi:hypothetical protein
MSRQPARQVRAATAADRIVEQPPRRRRRRWPAYLLGLVVVLGLLWVGYWYAAMQIAAAAINRATAAPIAGLAIGCPDRSLSGFPLRIDVRCQRATVADTRGSVAAALGGFWASVPLYWPATISSTLDAPLTLSMPDRGLQLTASWSFANATASAWLDGLQGGRAHFEALDVESSSGGSDALPVRGLMAGTADVALTPAGGNDHRLTANLTQLAVEPNGDIPLPPQMDVRASIVAQGVGPLGTDPAGAFLEWARNGASVKIDDFRLAASGAVVTVSGALALSKDGLLNGSILIGYNTIEALGDLIESFRPGTRARFADALKAVNVLTRSVNSPDGPLRQTSLTFQDGVIWLAFLPLPIDPVPPIRF